MFCMWIYFCGMNKWEFLKSTIVRHKIVWSRFMTTSITSTSLRLEIGCSCDFPQTNSWAFIGRDWGRFLLNFTLSNYQQNGKVASWLELPSIATIHNVFHVPKQKPYNREPDATTKLLVELEKNMLIPTNILAKQCRRVDRRMKTEQNGTSDREMKLCGRKKMKWTVTITYLY